jgi:hypothetical protein
MGTDLNGHHCYIEGNVLHCRAIVSIDHNGDYDEVTANVLRDLNLPLTRKKRVEIRVPLGAIECWYEETPGQTFMGLISGLGYHLDIDIKYIDSIIAYT